MQLVCRSSSTHPVGVISPSDFLYECTTVPTIEACLPICPWRANRSNCLYGAGFLFPMSLCRPCNFLGFLCTCVCMRIANSAHCHFSSAVFSLWSLGAYLSLLEQSSVSVFASDVALDRTPMQLLAWGVCHS